MGSIGPAEILVVLVVALIVLGPNRLPDAARSMGKAMAEFRRVTSGVQAEVRDAFAGTPSYPKPPTPASNDSQAAAPAPSSPEQSEIVVVREPDPPQSA